MPKLRNGQHYLPALFIGLCYLAITMMWTLYSAYTPVFLALDYGLSAAAIGFVMMLDNLAALLVQPWIGAHSDQLAPKGGGWGQRLPIIVAGAPFAAIGFALLPAASALPGGLSGFFLVLSIMLIAMAVVRTPLFALLPDLTPPDKLSTANGVINLLGGLGTLIAALGLGGLYRSNRAGPFWLAGATLAGAVLLLALAIRPRMTPPLPSLADPSPPLPPQSNVGQMLGELLAGNRRGMPLLLLAILCYTFGFNAIETFFTLYGRTRLGVREEQALMLVGLLFAAYLLASVPAGILGGRYGRRPVMAVGLAGLAALLLYAFRFESIAVLIATMPLGGVAWALVNSNALPAVVDMARPGRSGGAIGLFYAAGTLASILSPLANGWLVDRSGGNFSLILLTAGCMAALGGVCIAAVRETRRPALRANPGGPHPPASPGGGR